MSIVHFISARFITLSWCLLILIWIVSAFSVKPALERQSWAGRFATFAFLALASMLLLGKISLWSLNSRIWPAEQALRILACTITFAGLGVSVWSRFTLGPDWSATVTYREGHELIQRGPYRFVRHPMYTGFLLMVAGTTVNLGDASSLVAILICCLGIWWKLAREENMLTKHFPDSYRRYKSNTKALIPFVL